MKKNQLIGFIVFIALFSSVTIHYSKVTLQGAATSHVIYELEWITDHSAKVELTWSDPTVKEKIMLSGWSVEGDVITVFYQTGAKVVDGFSQRTIMGSDINMGQYVVLRPADQEVQTREFVDLPDEGEGLWAIRHLYYLGVLNGYTDQTIRPEGKVTRAEFAKMLFLSANFSLTEELDQNFSDVPANHWASPYIYTLATKNIVNGKGKGLYDPTGTITIAEVLTILNRSFDIFSEAGSYSYELTDHWSNEYFMGMVESGIVTRSDSFYRPYTPDRSATRQECAILLSRILRSYHQVKQ